MKQRNYSCQHRFTFKHICFFSLTTPSHFSLERLQDGGQAHPVTHKQKQIYFPKSNKKKRNTLSLSKHQLPLSCTRTHYYHTLTRFRFLYIYIYIYIYIFLHKSPLVSLSLSSLYLCCWHSNEFKIPDPKAWPSSVSTTTTASPFSSCLLFYPSR
jgi:hypothetical protein